MRLQPPEAVQALQRALYHTAKTEPTFPFSRLYDKVSRADVLRHAWALVRANEGAPGGEGVTIAAGEAAGGDLVLARLAEDLRAHPYRPAPIRRVPLPKRSGGERPLGSPPGRDRGVQAAAVLVLEPSFEADSPPGSYGFRPKKDAHQAVAAISRALAQGDTQVLDADLTADGDSMPQAPRLAAVAPRGVDRPSLRLCTQGLRAPVGVERDDGKREIRGGKRTRHGTPQGGVRTPRTQKVTSRSSER